MYADRTNLGFDPSVTLRKGEDDTTQYDIIVRTDTGDGLVYRTLELLSSPGIEYTVGRGTRVWKAVKIENGVSTGEPVALKDTWVDCFREREANINARIRNSTTLETPSRLLAQSLLTVLCHGDVFVYGKEDRTRILRDHGSTSPHETNRSRKDQTPATYQVHYRIVFREIGRDLDSTTSLAVIFSVLMRVAYGVYVCRFLSLMTHCNFRSYGYARVRLGSW